MDVVAPVVVVVSLRPCSRNGVASTVTFGKVVVAVAIAITIAVIAVVMNTFLCSFQMNMSIKYIYIRVWSEESTFIKKLMLDVFG